jgi:hypothetical protein
MKHLLSIVILLTQAGYIYAQSSETRALPDFKSIVISGNSKVYVKQDSIQHVEVETKNKLEDVITTVNNGILRIDGKPSTIYINTPMMNDITITGFGELKSENAFKTDQINVTLSGNGKIVLPVETSQLNADVSGFGKLKFTGSATNTKISISGNGTIDADKLITNNASVEISGLGKTRIDVRDSLHMNISGVGSVYYISEPKSITREINGIGKYGSINNSDTLSINTGNKHIVIIGGEQKTVESENDDDIDVDIDIDHEPKAPQKIKKSRSHWAGLDLGFNTLMFDKFSTDLPAGYDFLDLKPGKSIVIGLNLWHFDFPIYKRYLMLTTGLGLTLNNYRFSSEKTLVADTTLVTAAYDYNSLGEQINYTKNKLAVNYVTVPVLLQFNTHAELKKSFHFAAGLTFSYKYNSHLKLVYEENGDTQKTKRRDEFNIEPFRYDATIRLGYRNYAVFANYALTELFKSGKGPSLHPFSFGLQLAGW